MGGGSERFRKTIGSVRGVSRWNFVSSHWAQVIKEIGGLDLAKYILSRSVRLGRRVGQWR